MKAFVKIFFLLLLSSTLLRSQQALSSEFFDIVITKSAANIWDCKGSGAHRDVSFWKPTPPAGFFTFGHMASKKFHPTDKEMPVTIALKPKSGFEDLLKAPKGYEEVWRDYGSDGYRHVRIFRLVCPTGYKALGMVASANDAPKPDDNNCRCIKEMATQNGTNTRLVSRAMYGSDDSKGKIPFWDDRNSGANADVALWKPINTTAPANSGEVVIPPNTFFATIGYENQPSETPYALNLKFTSDIDESIELTNEPVLTRAAIPSELELKALATSNEYKVPFFAVIDYDYPSQIEQFLESPFYKIRRITYYKAIDGYKSDPASSIGSSKKYTITTGLSRETNHQTALGITMGVSNTTTVGIEGPIKGATVSASTSITTSLETSMTHSWGGSTTQSQQDSREYTMNIPPGKYGVLFQEISKYEVFRTDGTSVKQDFQISDNSFIEKIFPTANPPVVEPVVVKPAPIGTPLYGVESSRITCSNTIYILNKVADVYAQNGDSWLKIGYNVKTLTCENNKLIIILPDSRKFMYDGKPNKWVTPPVPPVTPNLNGKMFQFVISDPNGKGKCLDADGNTIGANGTKIQLWQPTGSITQKWKTTLNPNGTYTFVTADPNGKGKCLDADGNTISANGTKIQLWQPTGGITQQWKVTLNLNGTYTFVTADPNGKGKCLDADGNTINTNGAKIQLWQPTADVTQQWWLVEVK